MCVCCVTGYSRKGLVGVQAASAGGLLVGALLNRHAAAATCLCAVAQMTFMFPALSNHQVEGRMTANDTVLLTL